MTRKELQKVLAEHKKWLNGEGGKRAILRGTDLSHTVLNHATLSHADLNHAVLRGSELSHTDLRGSDLHHTVLRGSDLSHAVLRGSELRDADLRDVDLRDADLDYSCWPLWCGSLDAHIDTRIAVQLLYHLMRPCLVSEGVDDELKKALFTPELIEWANKFHRVEECGEIEPPKEG